MKGEVSMAGVHSTRRKRTCGPFYIRQPRTITMDTRNTKVKSRAAARLCRQSLGEDLDMVEADKVTPTNAEENKHRRTIILNRADGQPWGFTVQSYGIHHKKEDEVELLTYIDYVAHNGPAFLSGMRSGDVILSINGANMEDSDHLELIKFIKDCTNSMRMVVLFEDCCRKVELHHRYLKLKRVLAEKIFEVRSLEHQEMRIMSGLSRFDSCRSSRASTASSNSVFDDRRSLLPELDRCPTPRINNNHLRPGLNSMLCSPDVYSSSRSLSPLPPVTRFEFDRKNRPHTRAANVSVQAALNASLRNNGNEASGGNSPVLNRQSPKLHFEASPIFERSDGKTSLRPQCHAKRTPRRPSSSTPDYSLPPPNRELQRSGRHASAPDKLNPPSKCDISEALELSLFKLHISSTDNGESSTGMPDGNADSNHVTRLHPGLDLPPPKTSSLPQLLEYGEQQSQLGVKSANRHSTTSLNSSGGSMQFHMDSSVDSSFRCSSPTSDPGTPYSIGASSTDSNFSYSDLPVINVEMINDEDDVSHL